MLNAIFSYMKLWEFHLFCARYFCFLFRSRFTFNWKRWIEADTKTILCNWVIFQPYFSTNSNTLRPFTLLFGIVLFAAYWVTVNDTVYVWLRMSGAEVTIGKNKGIDGDSWKRLKRSVLTCRCLNSVVSILQSTLTKKEQWFSLHSQKFIVVHREHSLYVYFSIELILNSNKVIEKKTYENFSSKHCSLIENRITAVVVEQIDEFVFQADMSTIKFFHGRGGVESIILEKLHITETKKFILNYINVQI